jgi:hypothetical protein
MAHLKALRPHISADGVYRAVGEAYEDGNAEHVALRVDAGIVELAKGKSKKKDEAGEQKDEVPAGDVFVVDAPAGDVVVDAPAGETLIED